MSGWPDCIIHILVQLNPSLPPFLPLRCAPQLCTVIGSVVIKCQQHQLTPKQNEPPPTHTHKICSQLGIAALCSHTLFISLSFKSKYLLAFMFKLSTLYLINSLQWDCILYFKQSLGFITLVFLFLLIFVVDLHFYCFEAASCESTEFLFSVCSNRLV